jgi:hypothetical protein
MAMGPTPPYQEPPITPPGVDAQIITGGATIASLALTPAEQQTFQRDLSRLAAMYSLESPLYRLLMDDAATLQQIASLAKGSIGTNPVFNGIYANGNEIGMQLIRAPTVLSNNTVNNPSNTAPVYDWVQTYAASGWTNIFGSSSSYVDLSSTGITSYPVTNTQNRVMVAIIALLDPTPAPQIQEVHFQVMNITYPVQALAWETATDLFYAKLGGIYTIPVNGRFYMRGNIQPSSTGGMDQTELFGLTFATGDYLTYE